MTRPRLAYIWIVCLGAFAKQTGWHKVIHRTDRCDLSLLDIIGNNDVPLHAVVKSSRETTSCGSDYNLAYSR